jgi:hypothetical protein
MKETDLSDNELKLLVENAFQKLENTEEIDSKISAEKSNTLNWILALTTLFLGICLQNYKSEGDFCWKEFLYVSEEIIFTFSVIMLIVYKIVNTYYEKQKKAFLANLCTHKIELLFDIKFKVRTKLSNDDIFIPAFINRFRNGEFIPDYDNNRKEAFKTIDKKVSIFGNLLKLIYSVTMIAFIINLTITIILIMNLNRF